MTTSPATRLRQYVQGLISATEFNEALAAEKIHGGITVHPDSAAFHGYDYRNQRWVSAEVRGCHSSISISWKD